MKENHWTNGRNRKWKFVEDLEYDVTYKYSGIEDLNIESKHLRKKKQNTRIH